MDNIRIRKAYTDRADTASRNTTDTKDSGSLNYIDDTTDDEGLNEGDRDKLVQKSQVRKMVTTFSRHPYPSLQSKNDGVIYQIMAVSSWSS